MGTLRNGFYIDEVQKVTTTQQANSLVKINLTNTYLIPYFMQSAEATVEQRRIPMRTM